MISISQALQNVSEATIERVCRELDFRDSYSGLADAADYVDYYVQFPRPS